MKTDTMDDLDQHSKLRRETFALYGLSMYYAQCFEKSLAILVSCVFNKEFLTCTPDRREELQDEAFSKTVGTLLTRLRKQISIPESLDDTLDSAHKKRNWLAHNYYWERAGQIMTPNGCLKMIDELSSLVDYFDKLDTHLSSIYEKWMRKNGLSDSAIAEAMKSLVKEHE